MKRSTRQMIPPAPRPESLGATPFCSGTWTVTNGRLGESGGGDGPGGEGDDKSGGGDGEGCSGSGGGGGDGE